MKTKTNFSKICIAVCTFLGMFFLSSAVNGQNMNVAPDVINLNAQGNFENVQCIYGAYIASTVITSHNIEVSLNGIYIMQACHVEYCPVDNNLFVEFNRMDFQDHPFVQSVANTGPRQLTISGAFTVLTSTGATITYDVNRTGYIEVIKPGKK